MLVCKVSHSLQCFFGCKDTKKSVTPKEFTDFFETQLKFPLRHTLVNFNRFYNFIMVMISVCLSQVETVEVFASKPL